MKQTRFIIRQWRPFEHWKSVLGDLLKLEIAWGLAFMVVMRTGHSVCFETAANVPKLQRPSLRDSGLASDDLNGNTGFPGLFKSLKRRLSGPK